MNPKGLSHFMQSVDDSNLRHIREMERLTQLSLGNVAEISMLKDVRLDQQRAAALGISDHFTGKLREAVGQFQDTYSSQPALSSLDNVTLKALQQKFSGDFSGSSIDQATLESLQEKFLPKSALASIDDSKMNSLTNAFSTDVGSSSVDKAMSKLFQGGVGEASLPSLFDGAAWKGLHEPPASSWWSNPSYTSSLLTTVEAAAATLAVSSGSKLNELLGTIRAGWDVASAREPFLGLIEPLDGHLQSALGDFNSILFDKLTTQVHNSDDLLKTAAGVSALTDFLADYELNEDEEPESSGDISATDLTADIERLTTKVHATQTGSDVAHSLEQLVELFATEVSKHQPTRQQRILTNYVIPNLINVLITVTLWRLGPQPASPSSSVSATQNPIVSTTPVQFAGEAVVTCGQGRLMIRLNPDHNSDAVGAIADGTRLHIAQWHDGWALVEIRDGDTALRGWVAGAFLKVILKQPSASQ